MPLSSSVTVSLFITSNMLASLAIVSASLMLLAHACNKTCCQLVRHHSILETGNILVFFVF